MTLKDIKQEHKQMILKLFFHQYDTESKMINTLPHKSDINSLINDKIDHLIKNHQGVILLDDTKVLGYMFYILGDVLFGNQKCAVVPLYGHGAIDDNKQKIYQAMLNHASKDWIAHKRLSWVVRVFEHDWVLTDFWFKNGFGQRCADAIRQVEMLEHNASNITIKRANIDNYLDVYPLEKHHEQYYPKAPLCLPVTPGNIKEELKEWIHKTDHYLWIAYKNKEAVGYLKIEPTGESVISKSEIMLNITGLYVNPDFRNKHIGKKLLSVAISDIIKNESIQYLGVDYETTNPLGRAFWERYFTPYTKTLTRRIDEGIIEES